MKIWGMSQARKNLNTATANRRLRMEQFEEKRLLAIVWANELDQNNELRSMRRQEADG